MLEFTIAIILAPFIYCLQGYCFAHIWGWFLVPMGMPSITIPQAIGICIIANYLTHRYRRHDPNETTEVKVARYVDAVLYPPLALLAAFIFKYFL